MKLVEIHPSSNYPEDAEVRALGADHCEAYMVLGRTGLNASVVTATGKSEISAITILGNKLIMLREQFDLMNHEAFWRVQEREQARRIKELHQQLGMGDKDEDKKGGVLS